MISSHSAGASAISTGLQSRKLAAASWTGIPSSMWFRTSSKTACRSAVSALAKLRGTPICLIWKNRPKPACCMLWKFLPAVGTRGSAICIRRTKPCRPRSGSAFRAFAWSTTERITAEGMSGMAWQRSTIRSLPLARTTLWSARIRRPVGAHCIWEEDATLTSPGCRWRNRNLYSTSCGPSPSRIGLHGATNGKSET